MDYAKIAKQLSEAFESSGLSYGDLSERTGIAKSALHRYLAGDTKKIPVDRLNDICNALGINPREVVGWSEEPKRDWQLDLQAFGEKPPDDDIRLLIRGMSKLSPEQIAQAKAVFRAMFAATNPDLFDEGDDDHGT